MSASRTFPQLHLLTPVFVECRINTNTRTYSHPGGRPRGEGLAPPLRPTRPNPEGWICNNNRKPGYMSSMPGTVSGWRALGDAVLLMPPFLEVPVRAGRQS